MVNPMPLGTSDQSSNVKVLPIISSLRSGCNEIPSEGESLEGVRPLHCSLCPSSLSTISTDGSLHVYSDFEEDFSSLNRESDIQEASMPPHFASRHSCTSLHPQASQESLENGRFGNDITNQISPIQLSLLREGKKDISSCSLSPTHACCRTPPSPLPVSLTSERKKISLTPPPKLSPYLHDRKASLRYSSHFSNDVSTSSWEESRTKTLDQFSQEKRKKRSRINSVPCKRIKRDDPLFLSLRGTLHDSASASLRRRSSVHPIDEERSFIQTDHGKTIVVSPCNIEKPLPIGVRPSSLHRLCKPAPPVDSLLFLSGNQAAETLFDLKDVPPQKYLDISPSPEDLSVQKKTLKADESIGTPFLLSSPPFQWDATFLDCDGLFL